MQRYFSNEPPVYSKPKSQSGPAGSRPSQEDTTSRPPPPVPRPPVLQPPPPIASPLASPPSRPTPPPKPTSTISPVIPPPLPPAAPAHTPHSDYHSPISTQYHTVSLDRDPCSARSFRPNLNSRPFLRSHLYRRLYFRLLHSPCTAPLQPTYTIETRPSEQLFNLSRRHSLGGIGPR